MSDEATELDLPPVVSAQVWLAARKELLVREKALTKAATNSTPPGGACRWSR
jgi:predicted dithiol-disulfide oxidoreductase (DUF899 family)